MFAAVLALRNSAYAEAQRQEAEAHSFEAETQRQVALEQTQMAMAAQQEAEGQRLSAVAAQQEAEKQSSLAQDLAATMSQLAGENPGAMLDLY